MRYVFAIVDCASFYASCERIFDPALEDAPVVVLSNNDGCVIARSDEAKPLTEMGTPYHKVREQLEAGGARVFSSNYDLYGNMSSRVMEVLGTFSNEVQVYSIDEAFLKLPRLPHDDLVALGHEIRKRVMRWTGVPVRVGLGETKTLAKASQALAKQRGLPVFCIADREDAGELLAEVPIEAVWGVGRRLAPFLREQKILNARDLRDANKRHILKHLSVVGRRTILELKGIPCLQAANPEAPRHSILRSRSFGRRVTDLHELEEAVANYTCRAAEELRRYDLVAHLVQVFVMTGAHGTDSYYSNSAAARLPQPTSYTPALLAGTLPCLRKAYRKGYRYARAGVALLDLAPAEGLQGNLFYEHSPRYTALMHALDRVNRRMGSDTVYLARAGRFWKQAWSARCDLKSPAYTTKWSDLPVVFSVQ
jgi:DNA polymerase V